MKIFVYILLTFISFKTNALSYKRMPSPRPPSLAFVGENNAFKEALLKEKFPQEKISQVLILRRPNDNTKAISLSVFVQELLKLELNDEQMNIAIKTLYPEDIDKLSLADFTNKYAKDNTSLQTLSGYEKEMKKNEYESDRVLLKCKYQLLKNKDDDNGREIRSLLLQINNKLKDFSVNTNPNDLNPGVN